MDKESFQEFINTQVLRDSMRVFNRHIVVLVDGTWNTPTENEEVQQHYSNIYRLCNHILSRNKVNEQQIIFYYSGIGSKINSSFYLDSLWQGALANTIANEVAKIYINLSINYQLNKKNEFDDLAKQHAEEFGDKIYMFGFSRGSFTVYLVSRILDKYGLLDKNNISLWPKIWKDFIDESWDSNYLESFKKINCINSGHIQVEFMGLFDCVWESASDKIEWLSSLLTNNEIKSFFARMRQIEEKSHMPACVKTIVHILASDEEREQYKPCVFFKEKNLSIDDNNQILEQIWMPGVHCDIGGGYNETFVSDVSLLTMLDRVRKYSFLDLNFSKTHELTEAVELAWNNDGIIIHDEFRELLNRYIYGRQSRKIEDDKSNSKNFFKHPIWKHLKGKSIHYKNGETSLKKIENYNLKYINIISIAKLFPLESDYRCDTSDGEVHAAITFPKLPK